MSPSVRQLFHELVDLPQKERERIIDERRIPGDLYAEVESLLRYDSGSRESLTRRVSVVVDDALHSDDSPLALDCGPYRVLRLLGSGGMGAVYLAERRDGEIEQQVAIKLLRADAERPAWRERFLRERQLLAYLSHPSIARLLDAGHTDDDQPYLVMEYVDGVSIDNYAASLDLPAQLKLFLHVCDGVSHAHRHLIVHRDLKPSNILVDSSGHPKLLDFGIAKFLDVTGDATRTGERILTPNYASPEQLRGDVQTTATDIYSLGAVLYKLLTGQSPHELVSEARLTNRAITGGMNITAPSRLNPKLPRDIDHILRKALRDEPEERYASVDDFADDIRAFLEWRPVRARSGDAWYRARKFLRRFWIPVVAAVLTIASLSIGMWAVNRERLIAERRFSEVRQLSSKLFDIDSAVRQLPGGTKARQLIVNTSLDYLRGLATEARGDPDLMLDMGNAYMRVARVQGVPIGPNLGQMENAEQSLRIAEGFISSVLQARPDNRSALLRAAQIAHDRMRLAAFRRPDTAALPLAHECERWLDKYLSSGPVDEAEKDQVLLIGMHVANWYARKEQPHDALRLLRRMIEIGRAMHMPARVGGAQVFVAGALRSLGDLDGALAACREGTTLLEPRPGDTSYVSLRSFRLAMVTQGEILGEDNDVSLGRPQEAADLFERGFKIAIDLARRDPADSDSAFSVANDGIRLAGVLRHSDPGRSLSIYDETLRHSARILNHPRARRDEIRELAWSTYPLRQLGRFKEARSRLDGAFQRLNELKLYPAGQVELGSEPDDALRALAEYEAASANVRRAIEIYQELLTLVMASKPKPESTLTDAFHLSGIYRSTAALQKRAGHADLASALAARNLELWRHWERRLPNNAFVLRQLEEARAMSAAPVRE